MERSEIVTTVENVGRVRVEDRDFFVLFRSMEEAREFARQWQMELVREDDNWMFRTERHPLIRDLDDPIR